MRVPSVLRTLVFNIHEVRRKSAFSAHAHGFPTYIFAKNLFIPPHSSFYSNKIQKYQCPSSLGEENFKRVNEDKHFSSSIESPLSSAEIQRVNELVTGLCQNGSLQVALDLIDATLQLGCLLNSLNLDVFIDTLCKEREMVHARKFINEIKQKRYNVDILISTYRMLIDGYCKQRKLIEATELLYEMMQSDDPYCHPDASIFATVVEGCCKVRKLCEAIRVLRHMLDRSFSVKPDTQMILFRSLLWEARVREANKLQEMLGSLSEANHCSRTKVREVVVILDQMLDDWSD